MADSISAAATALPSPADIARAEALTREPFLHEGEDADVALAPGTPRRRALDGAMRELAEGLRQPSSAWRQEFSLLLGLERVLSDDEPKLVDGTTLSAHQVDALSGTLTALLAEAQRTTNGSNGRAAVDVLAAASILGDEDEVEGLADDDIVDPEPPEEEDEDDDDDDDDYAPSAADEDDDDEDDDDDVAAELEAELDRAELAAPDEDWDEEDDHTQDGDDQLPEQEEDPNAAKRFWFEHATGAGKTVAALGFVEASRTGGVLILTHRRNLVDQFHGELKDRGYKKRICPALLGKEDRADGPVTVETYQWFVRNAGNISGAYTIVICDEAHTALGEKTSAAIRAWTGPIFVGMTATGALIARHVADLFPTQTSRFDLAQAARRGVISPLRCVRIPPGPGVRTIAKVPLRRGEVDVEFDQEMLAELLDQTPFNVAIAGLYKTRFNGVPGVVYAAGVRHAYNLAEAFRAEGLKAMAVSGETKKRELASILARYERGEIDVLINAQLLAEGWNSPRATVCIHLAPTASKRIYQQRVGRVTRRHPGKEAGLVVDFVHPATKNDDPVVTLHSLLDRDVYRGGAIVVGPVRRGRGRRVRVERRVLPVCAEPERRAEVFERELWRIAVEYLDYGEQHVWAALAGARVQPHGWRRARAMLHFDRTGELRRRFLSTAVQRNKNPQLRLKALAEIAAIRDAEAFDTAIDMIGGWTREERREGSKIMLQAMVDKRIGRRDQANAWIWRMAEYTREVHEEYAVQRWPETKRLLGLLVNSSGAAHARNARRLVQSARKQDRRLAAALLASAVAHTPEAEEVLRGARTRMARKPPALARELLRNFPKRRGRGKRRRRRGAANGDGVENGTAVVLVPENGSNGHGPPVDAPADPVVVGVLEVNGTERPPPDADVATSPTGRRRRGRGANTPPLAPSPIPVETDADARVDADARAEPAATDQPRPSRRRRVLVDAGPEAQVEVAAPSSEPPRPAARRRRVIVDEAAPQAPTPAARRRPTAAGAAAGEQPPVAVAETVEVPAPKPAARRRPAAAGAAAGEQPPGAAEVPAAKPIARRRATAAPDEQPPVAAASLAAPAAKPARRTPAAAKTDASAETSPPPAKPARRKPAAAEVAPPAGEPKPARRKPPVADEAPPAAKPAVRRRKVAAVATAEKPAAEPPAKPARRRRTVAPPAED